MSRKSRSQQPLPPSVVLPSGVSCLRASVRLWLRDEDTAQALQEVSEFHLSTRIAVGQPKSIPQTLTSIRVQFTGSPISQTRNLSQAGDAIWHIGKTLQCLNCVGDFLSTLRTRSPLPRLSPRALATVNTSCQRPASNVVQTRLGPPHNWRSDCRVVRGRPYGVATLRRKPCRAQVHPRVVGDQAVLS